MDNLKDSDTQGLISVLNTDESALVLENLGSMDEVYKQLFSFYYTPDETSEKEIIELLDTKNSALIVSRLYYRILDIVTGAIKNDDPEDDVLDYIRKARFLLKKGLRGHAIKIAKKGLKLSNRLGDTCSSITFLNILIYDRKNLSKHKKKLDIQLENLITYEENLFAISSFLSRNAQPIKERTKIEATLKTLADKSIKVNTPSCKEIGYRSLYEYHIDSNNLDLERAYECIKEVAAVYKAEPLLQKKKNGIGYRTTMFCHIHICILTKRYNEGIQIINEIKNKNKKQLKKLSKGDYSHYIVSLFVLEQQLNIGKFDTKAVQEKLATFLRVYEDLESTTYRVLKSYCAYNLICSFFCLNNYKSAHELYPKLNEYRNVRNVNEMFTSEILLIIIYIEQSQYSLADAKIDALKKRSWLKANTDKKEFYYNLLNNLRELYKNPNASKIVLYQRIRELCESQANAEFNDLSNCLIIWVNEKNKA